MNISFSADVRQHALVVAILKAWHDGDILKGYFYWQCLKQYLQSGLYNSDMIQIDIPVDMVNQKIEQARKEKLEKEWL